jgi:hypothetical protein
MADLPQSPPPRKSPLRRILISAALIAFLAFTALIGLFIYRVTAPPVSVVITNQFSEYLPTVGPSDGILETATCSIPETFTQTDSAWLFDILPLGTTVSQIRVPAVYRYHVNLLGDWRFDTQGAVCIVTAPQFEPSLPPAILTAQMEKSTSAGWLRFNADESLANLEHGITTELNQRANDKLHRDYVREASRKAIAEFVKTFLIKQDAWRTDKFHQIIVQFPDDPVDRGSSSPPPTITFDPSPAN